MESRQKFLLGSALRRKQSVPARAEDGPDAPSEAIDRSALPALS